VLAYKLAQVLPVLLVVTFGTTWLLSLIPGSVGDVILGPGASTAAVDQFNKTHGYDEPLVTQYWHWLEHAVQGNFGTSPIFGAPISNVLEQAFPPTLELALITLFLSLLIAVPLGVLSAAKPGGHIDRVVTGFASTLISIPIFISCVLVLYLFSVKTNLLPPNGWVPLSTNVGENVRHALLPVMCLVAFILPLFVRVLRGDMVSILTEDFILTARARGLPEWYILTRHALRPASLSLLTLSAISFGYLFGGSLIVESYFSIPGLGQLVGNSINAKDIPTIQALVVLVSIAFLTANITVDLVSALIDPRIRSSLRTSF
jgi:peptide/nickel transport system permease protein